jgi:hypothetical protein
MACIETISLRETLRKMFPNTWLRQLTREPGPQVV